MSAARKGKVFRHGDVTLFEVIDGEVLVDNEIKKVGELSPIAPVSNELVIAEGEATGHHHRLTGAEFEALKGFDDAKYVRIIGGLATLSHEEHSALELPAGLYRQEQEQEYDYFENALRQVRD